MPGHFGRHAVALPDVRRALWGTVEVVPEAFCVGFGHGKRPFLEEIEARAGKVQPKVFSTMCLIDEDVRQIQ